MFSTVMCFSLSLTAPWKDESKLLIRTEIPLSFFLQSTIALFYRFKVRRT